MYSPIDVDFIKYDVRNMKPNIVQVEHTVVDKDLGKHWRFYTVQPMYDCKRASLELLNVIGRHIYFECLYEIAMFDFFT